MSATGNENQPRGYRIGDLIVDLVRREIRRQGRILPCGKLTFELLALLAHEAPRVVSRSLLVERLWSGRYVSPATIKRRVALLRETLGDKAEDPIYVRVVRGHGFALLPRVEPLGRLAVSRAPDIRYAMAACILVLTFVLGAEVGYQDGLRPAIPGRQGTETVVVTSWPHELSGDEYDLVMGAAEGFLDAVRRTDFVDRLDLETPGRERKDRDALTVVARATTDDAEAIYVTLGLLRDDRPDVRPSRDDELASWSRELQDVRAPVFQDLQLATVSEPGLRPAGSGDIRTHVLPASTDGGHNLMLVANYRLDRNEARDGPNVVPTDVADTVALAIDRQLPRSVSTELR